MESVLENYFTLKESIKDLKQQLSNIIDSEEFKTIFISAVCSKMDWKREDLNINSFGFALGTLMLDTRWKKDPTYSRYVFSFKQNEYNGKIQAILDFREQF